MSDEEPKQSIVLIAVRFYSAIERMFGTKAKDIFDIEGCDIIFIQSIEDNDIVN